ncbi:hypothetical protein SASPL_123327 [Salvia splendens]|uniref:Uncharacterized protein n=1 Tax=Salvia splendens TaxID=180675 RepID=A0A8X8XQ13_SALSN|nr:uncharacterized protein LOC121743111 [Salvia splendens]KAG6415908.1 hypothetical protein SASPL_123327 [Salvia splendens]
MSDNGGSENRVELEAGEERQTTFQEEKHKQRFKKSPLQNLNSLHFPKSNTKFTSNPSSSAAAPRNGCLRISLSSNSSSDASLPSSSSLERKPRSLPKVGSSFHLKSLRSKENEFPRKPFSDKPKRKQQLFVGRGNGKSKTNPISKTAQMSKISCVRGNSVKKGSEELKLRRSREIGLSETPLMSLNPVGSSGVRRNAAEESGSRTANGGSGNGSATSVKTPPVEISVSPEIQSKMLVLKSAATPVCYGTGHLLSVATDKRKCRRRGSLRGGCEKVNLFNEVNDENVVGDLQDPLMIPLPSEASVRWLLSPCNEGGEDQGSDSKNKCEISCGNYSLSPSTLCGNVCELGSDSEFRGSGSIDDVANRTKAEIFKLSRQQNSDRDDKICDALFAATPNSISNGNNVSLGEGNSSVVSLGCLSSGNLIQTPNSECSSYECIRGSNVEANQASSVQFELDSIAESLDAVSFSSRCESLAYAGFDSSSRSAVPVQLERNVCTSDSSSTLENLRLNQIRISWRDGIECSIDERDVFDCFPCVSDEEIGGSYQQLKPYRMSHSSKEKDQWMDDDVSPIRLEYEPCVCAALKDKATRDRTDACAESICTNGGDLAVSCDSD